jgi:hypothetical protein
MSIVEHAASSGNRACFSCHCYKVPAIDSVCEVVNGVESTDLCPVLQDFDRLNEVIKRKLSRNSRAKVKIVHP